MLLKKKPIIIALDYNNLAEVLKFIAQLDPNLCRLKVGKELFTVYGPCVVEQLQNRGFEVFLDLKFHDIPHTVYKAIKAACELGVWMVNVHASGGSAMLKKAVEAVKESSHKPLLIAVTVLTSLTDSDINEIGYPLSASEQALKLTQLAFDSGLDGVVCSAQEAKAVKYLVKSDRFLTVCPGIRLEDNPMDDQQRIMTPTSACINGADYIVIGRPITMSANPLAMLNLIIDQLNLTTY